jgi:hypothetical protein
MVDYWRAAIGVLNTMFVTVRVYSIEMHEDHNHYSNEVRVSRAKEEVMFMMLVFSVGGSKSTPSTKMLSSATSQRRILK